MRRLGQALVLLVMAICWACGATCSSCRAGVPPLLGRHPQWSEGVPARDDPRPNRPSKGTLDSPQVTLVRGSGGLASGGLVLFRTVPGKGTTAFLSVPPSAVLDGERVSRQSIPKLVHVLRAALGIQVSHVAVINLGQRLRPR